MRALVLGGTGLISQSIVSQMAARGDEVHIYNRGVTAAELPTGVVRAVGERSEIAGYRGEIVRLGFDCVVDMCGYTETDAEALVRAVGGEVPQVVFCSTTDVFVKGRGPYPLTERSPRGAQASFPYAVGKVASEEFLEHAAADGAFALTIIRPAQTYGGRGHGPNHPLGHRGFHIYRMRRDLPVILQGDGSSLWCAAFAPDVAAAFTAAIGNRDAYNRDYITAGDEVVTWARYWEIVGEAFVTPPVRLVTIPTSVLCRVFGEEAVILRENFQYNNVFDCTRAKDELGFRYTTSLHDGFSRVAALFGPSWEEEGQRELGTRFSAVYDRCLTWWQEVVEHSGAAAAPDDVP